MVFSIEKKLLKLKSDAIVKTEDDRVIKSLSQQIAGKLDILSRELKELEKIVNKIAVQNSEDFLSSLKII